MWGGPDDPRLAYVSQVVAGILAVGERCTSTVAMVRPQSRGHVVRCELPAGHAGGHSLLVEWHA